MEEKITKGVVYKEIKDIFEARDKAILQKDKELLKSTLLNTSHVYIPQTTKFSTEIITVVDDDKVDIKKVVFVKEEYSYKEYGENDERYEANERRYRIYHLVNTALGWRISQNW